VELFVHHLSVPEVVTHAPGSVGTHVDGHLLDRLGIAVIPQQFLSKFVPNRYILPGIGEKHSLDDQISEHRQLVVSFPLIHLVGRHKHTVVDTKPRRRHVYMGKKLPLH